MYKNNLIAVLRREAIECDDGNVIGIEIRGRRIALSKTLAALAEDLCSISYASKIENCRIEGSGHYLREICHRLDLDDRQIDILFKLKDILNNVVKAYFENDFEYIKEKYNKAKGLCNYRFKILELIYFIAFEKATKANKLVFELMKLASTMYDYDLIVFSLFVAILSYKNQSYQEAIETFTELRKRKLDETVSMLIDKYMVLSLVSLGSPSCLFEYDKYKFRLVSKGYYDELDYINYAVCVYLLRAEELYFYKEIFKSIRNVKYKHTLIYLLRDQLNIKLPVNKDWIKDFNDYAFMLYLINTNDDNKVESLNALSDKLNSFDYNSYHLNYKLLKTNEERYHYIVKKVVPKLEISKEAFYINYFLKELAKICDKVGKYKLFSTAYKTLSL